MMTLHPTKDVMKSGNTDKKMARQRKSMTFFAVPSVQSGLHALFVPKAAAVSI